MRKFYPLPNPLGMRVLWKGVFVPEEGGLDGRRNRPDLRGDGGLRSKEEEGECLGEENPCAPLYLKG